MKSRDFFSEESVLIPLSVEKNYISCSKAPNCLNIPRNIFSTGYRVANLTVKELNKSWAWSLDTVGWFKPRENVRQANDVN